MAVQVRHRPHSAGEAGQGIAEFALVFPIIVLLLFGALDIGRAVYAYNTIGNAAREGARVAAVNQLNPDDSHTGCNEDMPVEDTLNPRWWPKSCAASSAISLGVTPSGVSVSYAPPADHMTLICTPGALHVGCIATVTVSYTWNPLTPVIGNLIGPLSFNSTSKIPIERVFP